MKYAIVTGASRGLGEAIAKTLLTEEINVIGVSRTVNKELEQAAAASGATYDFYRCDLTSTEEIKSVFAKISEVVFTTKTEAVYLINNAGVIDPIETVGNLEEVAILENIQVNFTAPVLASNLLLRKAEEIKIPLIITTITSGAAERSVHGWSMYCSTKAAINTFTQTTGHELTNRNSNHKIIAFSPGIIDTEMQATIRTATEEAFMDLDKFRAYKEKNLLRAPQIVANTLVKLLIAKNLENGKIYNVNDLL